MSSVQTEIDIAADPSAVWAVLIDFAGYPQWSSYVREISGTPTVGGRLRVVQGAAGRRPLVFRARVLQATAGRELTWRGGVPGLYLGTHEFLLTARPGGGTHLLQRETFRGLLSGLFGAPRSWLPGYTSFNQALRRRLESPQDQRGPGDDD